MKMGTSASIEKKIDQIENPRLIEKLDKRYTACENDIIRLRAELGIAETLTTKAQQRRSFKQIIQEVGDYWDEVVKPDEIPIMIGNFVDKVVLTELSPRFFRATVHWSDPDWGTEEFL